jgi:hypothetical protein
LIVLAVLLILLILAVGAGVWVGMGRGWFGNQPGAASGPAGESPEPTPGPEYSRIPAEEASDETGKQSEAPPAEASAAAAPADSRRPDEPPSNIAPNPEASPSEANAQSETDSVTSTDSGFRRDDEGRSVGGGSFFGIRADGRRFVYVVDCSGSMNGQPFERATAELLSSLANLAESQQFFVILFSTDSYPMFHPTASPEFLNATDDALKRVKTWLREFSEGGAGTEPEPSLVQALSLNPDAVFFLSDGAVPNSTADTVRTANPKKVPVHAIGFTNRAGETVLKQIAHENRGRYRFVP